MFALLKETRPPSSIVSNKIEFARRCREHRIPTVPVIAFAENGRFEWLDPDGRMGDWFVKPNDGKGGKGIERWDRVCAKHFESHLGQLLTEEQLVRRLIERSQFEPCIVQPRMENHAELSDLNNGALATVRALTCLDEADRPELVAAVLRMAVGNNHVVDNVHAGGIVASIDLQSGMIGSATNLGDDASLGWLDRHPGSGAIIRGRILPSWGSVKPLVEGAHCAFRDRALIGWDIALTSGGWIVVEANGAPDLDIMQRPCRNGFIRGRLGELLAHNLLRAKVIPESYEIRFPSSVPHPPSH